MDYSKTIEQLEKDYWKELIEYPSDLIKNCFDNRKIAISDLSIEQIRTLISQNIGLDYLINLTFEKLEHNILAEGDFYKGDLLVATIMIIDNFWKNEKLKLNKLEEIVRKNSNLIISEMGEKKYDRLISIIEKNASA